MLKTFSFDPLAAKRWITEHVSPVGEILLAHERPWAAVLRVPTALGDVWFKACGPVQRFEPYLTRDLSVRWPTLMPEVLACDEQRSWMLTADAGTSLGARGNPPEAWLAILPRYAQLQFSEVIHVNNYLDRGVPDLRLGALPLRYVSLLEAELPTDSVDANRFKALAPRFDEMCLELRQYGFRIPFSTTTSTCLMSTKRTVVCGY